jgi:type IV pilus assembly protein PilQ
MVLKQSQKNSIEESMKKTAFVVAVALVFIAAQAVLAQGNERKAFREYTSPQELVSIAPTTPLDKALAAISEVSMKFVNKPIVDTERRSMPINVDIQGLQWRDALDAICRKNDLTYNEYENYIQIGSLPSGEAAGRQAAAPGAPAGPVSGDIPRELASFRSREIKISAVFLEVDLARIEEVGINWSFMKSTSDVTVASTFEGADRVSDKMFKTEVTPKLSFATLDFIAQVFSNYNLGEILSGPQLTVRSGEEGRIQVGQDFSVRERDFAGNLIDRFYSAGTIIKVTPQVITEQGVNFIHIKADVERSSVTPGSVSTIINKTKATTNLLLLDGEETIIGGLYNNEVTTTRTGVPFLKDLPWYIFGLRYIFGYNNESITKKELIILMKAELVPTLQERIAQKAKEDGIFERWRDEQAKRERHIKGSGK